MTTQSLTEKEYQFNLFTDRRDDKNNRLFDSIWGNIVKLSKDKSDKQGVTVTLSTNYGNITYNSYDLKTSQNIPLSLNEYIDHMLNAFVSMPEWNNSEQRYKNGITHITIVGFTDNYGKLNKETTDMIFNFLEIFGTVKDWEFDGWYNNLIITLELSELSLTW